MRDRRRDPNSVRSHKARSQSDANSRREASLKNPEIFKACFEHATIGFSITDLEGRLLEVNPAYCSITGYSEAELWKTHPETLTHPEDLPSVVERIRALIAGEIPDFVLEKRYVQKSGAIVWVQNSASLLRDENGRPQNIVRVTQDITERKLAESTHNQIQELLRQSKEELADAQQLATLGSWSWDIKTGLMTWSDELYRMFGLHPQEIRASFEAAIRRVHPEDRGRVLQAVERCIKTQERYSLPNRIIRSDGKIRLLQVLGSVVADEHGMPVRMFGLCQDITELEATKEAQRAAERKYSEIVENAGEGIFQSTPEGGYLMANPALARMHGFSSAGELIQSCKDISHEIYVNPEQREEFKRMLERHGVVRDFEHETFRKDGSKIWISVNARAVRDEAGKILYYEGTAQDVTERKQAQEASRTYSRRLIEAQEAERRRISRELHDQVGQILTAVKMNLHSLRERCSEPEILSSIEDNMKVIDEAVDEVRDLSVDLRPLLLDDFGLVIALRWYLARQAKSCGVPAEFTTRSLREDDRFSSELETACFRIVQEGITNVVRHARASRISVTLERNGPDLVLLIADDGAGFDIRVLSSRAATLGLRGMEERVQALGGSLTIDSAPAYGTEICARFPINEAARAFSSLEPRLTNFAKRPSPVG